MARYFVFPLLSILLLSSAIVAQTPGSTTPASSPTTSATVQSSPSPSATSIAPSSRIPNLPAMVEIIASGVMLVTVLGALWSLVGGRRIIYTPDGPKDTYGPKIVINPRHIQFISVGLIVPTILILGLEKVLTSETTATLIGGLAGYLLSGIGAHEPKPPAPNKEGGAEKDKDKDNDKGKGKDNDKDKQNDKVTDNKKDDQKDRGSSSDSSQPAQSGSALGKGGIDFIEDLEAQIK